jgi:hypothetical protein
VNYGMKSENPEIRDALLRKLNPDPALSQNDSQYDHREYPFYWEPKTNQDVDNPFFCYVHHENWTLGCQ